MLSINIHLMFITGNNWFKKYSIKLSKIGIILIHNLQLNNALTIPKIDSFIYNEDINIIIDYLMSL